jgi:PAS domain S-box-containing protein
MIEEIEEYNEANWDKSIISKHILTLENYYTILEQVPFGIAISHNCYPITTKEKSLVLINSMYEKITGRKKEELIRIGWSQITHPDDLEKDLYMYNKLMKGSINSYSIEKRFIKPNGSSVWVLLTAIKLECSNKFKNNHISIIRDITDWKKKEYQLKYANEHDKYTGLYNQRFFEGELAKESIEGKNCKRAILLIDFNKINSISLDYGYHFSTNLIKAITYKLQNLENEKRRIFQISFEKFAFYIKGYDHQMELAQFCEEIFDTIKEVQILNHIGCSIGIFEIEEDNYDAESIIKNVSIAAGRTSNIKTFEYCYYDGELEEKVFRENYIKDELFKIVMGKNNKKFYLQYQPIIDLRTNKIHGFEALARFQSKELGLVSPAEFIPIAEEMQFIVPIGLDILHMACKFIKKLELAGYDRLSVFVNVSTIQLLRDEFVSDLRALVEGIKINPRNLGIEITESIFMDNCEMVNKKLYALREMGIEISIDDFGTGYSSIYRLRELNVDCIKIDKYFIDKLLKLKTEEVITGDIISMAHKLGCTVIAEGVEHEKQKQYLIDNNCDFVQGYLFSKPLYEKEALRMLGIQD